MMSSEFKILPLKTTDIPFVMSWARLEGFAPGCGDVDIYRNTDSQGLWVAWLDHEPIGCISGVRYNDSYGFIGLFLVVKTYRGNGYGVKLWKHALEHLVDVPCIGLEAALNRIDDYSKWGFVSSSVTTRWQCREDELNTIDRRVVVGEIELNIIEGSSIPSDVVQLYDAQRECSPRPHFLSDWLKHPEGKVLAMIDKEGNCHGFGRIRPCLLSEGNGWRIGPLLANNSSLARLLVQELIQAHPGIVLIDSPGLNKDADTLFELMGFRKVSTTMRMYKGELPPTTMSEVYALACLELG